MFSGIVEEVGSVLRVVEGADVRVTIGARTVLEGTKLGDSISVSGCCLTVVAIGGAGAAASGAASAGDDGTGAAGHFEVELSRETVAKTAPRWRVGARVNLERALRVSDRLGGHIVSGHVDGVGEVLKLDPRPGAYVLRVAAPPALAPHLVPKGSVTVDGVSLTLVDVGGPGGTRPDWPAEQFSLWLIPHTLEVTTLGELRPGSRVNVESDLLAKYVERLQLLRSQEPASGETR